DHGVETENVLVRIRFDECGRELLDSAMVKVNDLGDRIIAINVCRNSGNGADVAIPFESIRAISERFVNSAYGFFLGKQVAYPVVANYFSSEDGLDAMLENGLWFIRNNPFILKKWNPDVNLQKEDVGCVSVWVKFHGIPMTTLSYARAMIDLRTDKELKYSIMVAMLKLVGRGFNMCTNLNNPRQATRGVPVGPKVSFKSTKNFTNKNGVSTSSKKNEAEVSRQEVSNSNPFDTLNSIKNDDDLVRMWGIQKRQILDGKLMFVDNDRNPLVPMEPPRVERPVSPAPTVPVPVNTAAESTIMEDNLLAPVDNDPFVNVFAPEPSSEASSSRDVSSAASTYVTQTHYHLGKWSKDHPLDNVIGNPSRPVSIRKQLATDALWCFYNSVLSKVEPKNFKSAITEDCWFQAMQDEIHEFDQLQVWKLVPQPDCVMIIALKWIYKVKLDEYGDVLKNSINVLVI
nr:integrase, catalytic region, zinc finger, CCHC-type, peptidase aspartic, catalytic [Tanacetum cinerariifolium]